MHICNVFLLLGSLDAGELAVEVEKIFLGELGVHHAAGHGEEAQHGEAAQHLAHQLGEQQLAAHGGDDIAHLGVEAQTAVLLLDVEPVEDGAHFLEAIFRRILCAKLGDLVEQGQYPCDVETLGELVRDVCHRNAKRYFSF